MAETAAENSTEITMPQMGADMEEGTLLHWLKHPGDHVERGEVIAEIETDKANVEIESFVAGVLQQTLVGEGQVVPVGEVIALVGSRAVEPAAGAHSAAPPAAVELESRDVAAAREPDASAPATGATSGAASEDGETPRPDGSVSHDGKRMRVSPVARNVAGDLGVELTTVQGSGPDGRIMRKDVERAAAAQRRTPATVVAAAQSPTAAPSAAPAAAAPAPPSPPNTTSETLAPAVPAARAGEAGLPGADRSPVERQPAPAAGKLGVTASRSAPAADLQPLSRIRQATARRMAQSKREVPHYYVTAEIDMTDAMSFRAALNHAAGEAGHISVNDLIVKACVVTLRRYPAFNASFTDEGLQIHPRINVCIAVALPDGLVAPALLDADEKSLGALARDAKDLTDRARGGGLRGPELVEGTFTVSNLGMYGIETLIPIIQPPQSAILGVGAVQEKPAVRDGQIVPRQLMVVALAADHRVTDGARGGEFLRDFKRLLEQPLSLAL